MSKINIKDANNVDVVVNVVRYFKHKDTSYFIYTKDELDEKGFVKLYIVKIMKQLGSFIARTIKDDEEWKMIQLLIKKYIKEIKNQNIQSFFDLDRTDIENIKIKDARFFKLDKHLMQLLTKDSTSHISTDSDNIDLEGLPEFNEIAPVEVEQIDEENYKELYMELKKDNEELNETMANMLLELSQYRMKYGSIEEGS